MIKVLHKKKLFDKMRSEPFGLCSERGKKSERNLNFALFVQPSVYTCVFVFLLSYIFSDCIISVVDIGCDLFICCGEITSNKKKLLCLQLLKGDGARDECCE